MGTSLTASTLPAAAAVEQPQPRSNRAARPPVFARHPRDIPPRVPLAPQPRVLARVPARARAKNPRVLARAPVAAARGRARGRANFRRRRANFRPPPREDRRLRAVLYERTSGWSSKASVEVERRRGWVLKARGGRRDTTGKVLKDRRSPSRRGRMGTSVR